jgi:hypothetical protein
MFRFRFDMDGDRVRSGVEKARQIMIGILDHEMARAVRLTVNFSSRAVIPRLAEREPALSEAEGRDLAVEGQIAQVRLRDSRRSA